MSERICGATIGELLCTKEPHPKDEQHEDGVAKWNDGDPPPPRTKDHTIGAGGACTRCRGACLADVEVDPEDSGEYPIIDTPPFEDEEPPRSLEEMRAEEQRKIRRLFSR